MRILGKWVCLSPNRGIGVKCGCAMSRAKTRVSYFYDHDLGSFYYGAGHPMKPQRLRMTHHLVLSYGLYKKMEVFRPHPASRQEMLQFHGSDFLEFIERISPETAKDYLHQLQKFNLGPYTDCPLFSGLYEYCQLTTGASLDGAVRINQGLCDVAINWSGGMHHAKKREASGFCYVNDIVLAILELLKYHARVLYVDIDIHHGDGVEEAFFTTNRVMTMSFHKFGDFFPGTGDLNDVGTDRGKFYSINFPLGDGMDDECFRQIFEPMVTKAMEVFRPSVVVMQGGADSITGDRLGCFNITPAGHGACMRFVRSFGLPMLVVGGGGYNIRNVARTWVYDTSLLIGTPLSDHIPYNDFFQYYAPDFKLHLRKDPELHNMNSRAYVEKVRTRIFENLRHIEHAPSVQMHRVPPDFFMREAEERDQDVRWTEQDEEKEVRPETEFFEDDKDNVGEEGADMQLAEESEGSSS